MESACVDDVLSSLFRHTKLDNWGQEERWHQCKQDISRNFSGPNGLYLRCVHSLVVHACLVCGARFQHANLLVIEKETFNELGLSDGRVSQDDELDVASLHLLGLAHFLVEDFFVVVRA